VIFGRRVSRLLLVAFALSLLLHLIVALALHPPIPTAQNQAEVVSIEHRPASIAMTKAPTPPPPRPLHTPSTLPKSSSKPTSRNGPGAGQGGAAPATPAPVVATAAPTATTASGCSQPNANAAVVATPSPPDIAPDARAEGTSGTALVHVELDPSGTVTRTSVTQSSGNSSLDLVAVGMARESHYSPALHDCKPIAAAYDFSVKFIAW
jgi:periplasmic protein TonB